MNKTTRLHRPTGASKRLPYAMITCAGCGLEGWYEKKYGGWRWVGTLVRAGEVELPLRDGLTMKVPLYRHAKETPCPTRTEPSATSTSGSGSSLESTA